MIRITFPGSSRFRSSPSLASDANVLGMLAYGTQLSSFHREGEWYFAYLPVFVHQSVAQEVDSPPGVLPVPYISQWGYGANRVNADCGQACVKMILASQGLSLNVPVDTLSKLVGAPAGWTTADHLISLLKIFGLRAVQSSRPDRYPAIALVDYSKVPDVNKLDKKFKDLHWIVLLGSAGGRIYYHDPDWWGNDTPKGAFLSLAEDEFEAASRKTFILLEET